MKIKPTFILEAGLVTKPQVYGWRRGLDYLYIGISTKLFGRLSNHHILGVREKVLHTDYIDIWSCETYTQAKDLEIQFIREYRPKYNSAHKPSYPKDPTPREFDGTRNQLLSKEEQRIVDNLRRKMGPKR